MKILFVCRANVGRSQMAEELFNKYCLDKGEADSAGTKVFEREGEIIKNNPLKDNLIRCMKEEEIDLSKKTLKQITREMCDKFDKIIIMAEPDTIPKWLSKKENIIIWNILDPKGMDYYFHCDIREKIKNKIQEL